MTGVTIVAPIVALYLTAGLFAQRGSRRLWFFLGLGTTFILALNIFLIFR